jgi:DNA-directed RNA polymerase subunit RPC12/RpoP
MDELRDFRCGACEAEFATWQEMDDHRRQAHPAFGADPGVRCPTCGHLAASQPELDRHQRETHEIPLGKPAVEVADGAS